MSKLEELKELRKQINLNIKNLDNYPNNDVNILIANHNCLMDIFYLPMALPQEIVSLISVRLVYKNENNRKDTVNRYLHALPIEAHGGYIYANICLEQAIRVLHNGKSISIFPEGAYVYDRKIFKGHTGASRIAYNIRNNGKKVNLVPISINVSKNDDLDNYNRIGDDVEVTILPPIDYEDAYYNYKHSSNKEERNMFLHQPIDTGMQCIADNLKIPYEDHYIELSPKGNVMFEDGSTIDVKTAQNKEYISRYKEELNGRTLRLLKKMK